MKKIISLILSSVLLMGVVSGCSNGSDENETPAESNTETQVETATEDDNVAEGDIVKLGLGIITSIDKSSEKGDKPAKAQVDTTTLAAGFDEEGKIVSVSIDTAQNAVDFDEEMAITTDLTKAGLTKKEQGDDYGMKAASEIEKEWYEQIEALEDWMVGKTVDEVMGMKVKDGEGSVPDEEELTSSVTIKAESYLEALEKAYKNAIEIEKGVVKVGLGHDISLEGANQESDKGATAKVNDTVTAVALDKDEKIVDVLIDTAQTEIEFDAEGKLVTDSNADFSTKKEQGDDYGMKAASEIEKEWYEQIEALEDWMVGKTVDEVLGMKVKDGEGSVPDEQELTSSVTIKAESYLGALEKAVENAK